MSDIAKYRLMVLGSIIGAFMGLSLAALWLEPFWVSAWLCGVSFTLGIVFSARLYKGN